DPTVNDALVPEVRAVLLKAVFVEHVIGEAHIVLQTGNDCFVFAKTWFGRRLNAVITAGLVALRTVVDAADEIGAAPGPAGQCNFTKTGFNLGEAGIEEAVLVDHIVELVSTLIVARTLDPGPIGLGPLWVAVCALLEALLGNRVVWSLCLGAHVDTFEPSATGLNRKRRIWINVAVKVDGPVLFV
ncbi:MAG: hypothetical protein VYB98_08285, partial [Actinomycetota bacterium]|nr:hypothetical protein [Actinomycetota bacterium]